MGMLVVGIVATSAYREELIRVMKPGEEASIAGYTVAFRGVAPATGPNYREVVGLVLFLVVLLIRPQGLFGRRLR